MSDNAGRGLFLLLFKKNQNAFRPSEHPSVRGKNVKTFSRWDHRLQIQFLTFNVLVANTKKTLYTVANPARGLLTQGKEKKKGKWTQVAFSDKVGGGKMQTSSPPVITPNRSQSNPDDMITLPRPIQSVGMDLHDVSGTSTGQTLPRERRAPPGHPLLSDNVVGIPTICYYFYPPPTIVHFFIRVRNIPSFDHSSTFKRRPQTSVTAADLVWVCAPPRTILKWLRRLASGSCGPGRKILAAATADLVWVCAPPRTIRKWLRRLAFWTLRTRAQEPCSCCCRPGVGLRHAADHPQMVTTPGVLDPADPRARSLQLLLDISDKSG